MTEENGIFYGMISHLWLVPGDKGKNYVCPVCGQKIPGSGLHVKGYIVNPAIQAREVAGWLGGMAELLLSEQDRENLFTKDIPGAVKVDFYCHDYICLSLFFRNKYPINPGLLPGDINDIDKFRPREKKRKAKPKQIADKEEG
jgi:hypothetical protein